MYSSAFFDYLDHAGHSASVVTRRPVVSDKTAIRTRCRVRTWRLAAGVEGVRR
jgi:hypothetical protein